MKISPAELKNRLDQGQKFRLVDVREPDEWAIARIPTAELLPMSQFQSEGIHQLAPSDDLVVYCHHGVRSARIQAFLLAQGFTNVANLTGGIDAWAQTVDRSMPRY